MQSKYTRKLRGALWLVGLSLVGIALSARFIGLGGSDDFTLYRLIAVRRIDLAALGVTIIVFGALWPIVEFIWRRRAWVVLKILPNFFLVCASIVLTILVGEFALRTVDGIPLFSSPFSTQRTSGEANSSYHPTLGWIHRSNLRINPERPHLSETTGENGIRMNSTAIKPVPQRAILAVGDSFTYGVGVGDAETWPAALERKLGQPVINGGLAGYGTDQIILTAEHLFGRLAPKLLIVDFLDDDIRRSGMSVFGAAPKPYFVVDNGELALRNVPVPQKLEINSQTVGVVNAVVNSSYLLEWISQRLGITGWRTTPVNELVNNNPVEITCLLLARAKTLAASFRADLLLVLQWQHSTILNWRERPETIAAILQCAKTQGVMTLDTWEPLRSVNASDPDRFRAFYLHDGHMSAAGNEFIADLIYKQLTR